MCVCVCMIYLYGPTVPVLGAQLTDFLEKFRLLLSSYVQKKAQHQLCPQRLKSSVYTLWLTTTQTHTSIQSETH